MNIINSIGSVAMEGKRHISEDTTKVASSELQKNSTPIIVNKKNDIPNTQYTYDDCHRLLTENYYTCTNEVLKGLSIMYVSDLRFKNNIDKYSIVYIKKPSPIILKDIDDVTLTVDGVKCNVPSIGDAPDVLHQYILDRAVALAKQTYISQ